MRAAGPILLRTMLLAGMLRPLAGLCEISSAPAGAARGERLFDGREPITGRLAGHTAALPPRLGACIACHGVSAQSSMPSSTSSTPSPTPTSTLEARAAPPLGCAALSGLRVRRGEPPYTYDRANFCRTVRTGSNPNYVVLQRTMPRFELDESQCDALWDYLAQKREGCRGTQ